MAGDSTDGTATLREILQAVEDYRQVVTVYNYTGDDTGLGNLRRFFGNQNVELRSRRTPDGVPRDFVVLHRKGEFLAADRFEDVHTAAMGREAVASPDSLETMPYPTVLDAVDHTIFEGYDKSTMIGISRGVEQFAWRAAEGEIHAGFQRLSLIDQQREIYESLADRGVGVHVYGQADTDARTQNFTTHAYDDEEITRSWFVVFDRDDGPRRGLLAWERVPGDFHGFWTTRDEPIDAVLARVRERFPPTG